MPRMISPAGNMDIKFLAVDIDQANVNVRCQFGAWDSKICMGPEDIKQLIGMMPKWKLIGYLIRLPFLKQK